MLVVYWGETALSPSFLAIFSAICPFSRLLRFSFSLWRLYPLFFPSADPSATLQSLGGNHP